VPPAEFFSSLMRAIFQGKSKKSKVNPRVAVHQLFNDHFIASRARNIQQENNGDQIER
jgi:hypothetical protein